MLFCIQKKYYESNEEQTLIKRSKNIKKICNKNKRHSKGKGELFRQ